MQTLKSEQNQTGDVLTVTIFGAIDERAEFPPLDNKGKCRVVIESAGVNYMNSAGIRRWIRWLQEIDQSAAVTSVDLRGCRPVMIEQISVVKALMPSKVRLASVYLPFTCEACDFESEALLEAESLTAVLDAKPGMARELGLICGSCGQQAEPNVIDSLYLKAVAKASRP